MKPKFSILILLACLTASAQYRFNLYTATIATNASIATNAVATYGQSFDVGAGTEATIQVAFKLNSTNVSATATNAWVTVWDTSMDGTRFTNRFTFSVYGNGTTNTEAWGTTNFTVEWPWLRFVNATNLVGETVTNPSVKVGNKIGL